MTVLTDRMWDWSTSRKTGSVKVNVADGAVITSARFVNELYSRIVVLAETSTFKAWPDTVES